jgi:dihydrofolate reductase
MGHHLIMGRKTYETIGKPLPGRVMIVVTHQKDYFPIGCMTVHSINAAIKLAKKKHETEVFIIGGGEIFNQALDLADKIYLTTVHADIEADIYFTEINKSLWTIMKSEETTLDENDEYTTDFQVLVRNYEKQG